MFCLNTEEKTIVKYTNNKWIIIIIDIYVDIFFEIYVFFFIVSYILYTYDDNIIQQYA